MRKSVDFYFDVGSPAAYIAWTQMPALCQQTGATLNLKPILLGGVFQSTGNRAPISVPAKGKYLMDDLARYASRYGCSFKLNSNFPINTLTFMRAAAGLQLRGDPRLVPFLNTVLQAIWVDDRNMNDPTVVAEVLEAAGFDPAELMALAGDAEVKEHLKLVTQQAVDRGIFGAPAFFVDNVHYWGQDRLDFVREALSA